MELRRGITAHPGHYPSAELKLLTVACDQLEKARKKSTIGRENVDIWKAQLQSRPSRIGRVPCRRIFPDRNAVRARLASAAAEVELE